jgi:NAD(P)-dependent dehydrogenase (short-subunit alcohol dehydrogenase family)
MKSAYPFSLLTGGNDMQATRVITMNKESFVGAGPHGDTAKWDISRIPAQVGRIAVVTGANSGIGFATSKALAMKGAEVVLACRTPTKAHKAMAEIRKCCPEAKLHFLALDLGSLSSVADFGSQFKNEFTSLDMLINNAGIMIPPYGKTADGFETQFGTNHLGHFALTGHLLPVLKTTPKARVVTVSSIAHRTGRINYKDLHSEKSYIAWGAYSQSKLANLLFSYELQRRFEAHGIDTQSLAAHPGCTNTELGRHMDKLSFIARLFLRQTPLMGALPTLRAATEPEALGGQFYGPEGFLTMAGHPIQEKSSKRSRNEKAGSELWVLSEELSGICYDF